MRRAALAVALALAGSGAAGSDLVGSGSDGSGTTGDVLPSKPSGSRRLYAALLLRSAHLGNDKLNDNTPGLMLGLRAPLGWPAQLPSWLTVPEWHVEGGVFYNSYEEVSPIAVAGLSAQVARLGPGALRLGGSVGIARYEELSADLKEDWNIPNVDGYIPIVALTAVYRVADWEARLSTVPPGEDTLAILNLSVAYAF